VISAGMRPKLADKARLRHDRKTGRTMLLYPERGLELSTTASDILRLCTGEHTVESIVDNLAAKYEGQSRDVIAREVHAFLDAMRDRALVRDATDG
jgi:coenzyme PQQ biosynthesis protein PqqD